MAIKFTKTTYSGHFPVFWRGECKMLPAGYAPVQDFASGTVIPLGTLLYVNTSDLTAAVIKLADALEGSTEQEVRVAKTHLFAVGDVVTKVGDGSATVTISSIDTSNDDYDVLTLSEAYTDLAEGDTLVESKAVESGTATSKYTPNAVVGSACEVKDYGAVTIDAAYEAVVLYPSLDFTVPSDFLTGLCLTNNPNILFIKQ